MLTGSIIAKKSDAKICSKLSKIIVEVGHDHFGFENDYDHPNFLYIIDDDIEKSRNIAKSYGSKLITTIGGSEKNLDEIAKDLISKSIDLQESLDISSLKNEDIIDSKSSIDLFILGGAGPAASADFFDQLITKRSDLSIIHLSLSCCPSKYKYLSGKGPSFVPHYQKAVMFANSVNAKMIVTPCNTNHVVMHKDLDGKSGWSNSFKGKVLDYRDVLCEELKHRNVKKALILGTNVTTRICKLYHNSLKNYNIEPKITNREGEKKIMDAILKTKAGKISEARKLIDDVIEKTRNENDMPVVLACTELPLVYSKKELKEKNLICISSLAINKLIKN